jgi:hypothetical protein
MAPKVRMPGLTNNLNARAYANGTKIHIAPGQTKHLPHEAWHVVDQKGGRAGPFPNGSQNLHLEKEADLMASAHAA